MLTFGSLFAGIGGIDLGLERAGMECAWQVENDEYCSRVLAKHWPDIPRWGDAKTFLADTASEQDRRAFERRLAPHARAGRVDLIAGGFPCQPVSAAGKQKAQADSRWLWPEFARIIRELRPRYVLVENVPGLLTAQQGRAAQEVFGDLAELGFDADWASIPAAAVGAPHLRYRVLIVAHSQRGQLRNESGRGRWQDGEGSALLGDYGTPQLVAHAGRESSRTGSESRTEETTLWGEAEVFSAGRGQIADTGGWWAVEPDVGRVANGVPRRVDRLRALGNAVVPQVAEWVGRQIVQFDQTSCGRRNNA